MWDRDKRIREYNIGDKDEFSKDEMWFICRFCSNSGYIIQDLYNRLWLDLPVA